MGLLTFASLGNKIKGLVSGVDSVTVDGTTLHFVFTDGTNVDMAFPTPKDGVSINDVSLNSANEIMV